jgi:hypothetical protein
VFEGHPLNWVWKTDRAKFRLRDDGDYFARAPRVNEEFPDRLVGDAAPFGAARALALERQWTLGAVVSELVATGLTILCLEEHPEHFRRQFPDVTAESLRRLPHTFSLLARRGPA